MPASRDYRRWAFESAAARPGPSAGGPAFRVGDRPAIPRPVTFVVSMRLGDPPTTEQVRGWLEHYPGLRFKLDPTERLDRRARRRAGRAGLRRLGRPQGPVQGHRRRPAAQSELSTGWSPKASPRLGSRIPRSLTRRGRSSSHTRRGSPGTRSSTPSPISKALPVAAAVDQHQAVAVRQLAATVRRVRLLRGERHRALRRRSVRARPGARSHPVPRLALPSRSAERRGAERLQRERAAARTSVEPRSTRRLSRQGSGGAGLRSKEMSKARLASFASVLLAVALLAAMGWLAWSWYDSRLPGSYSAMDLRHPRLRRRSASRRIPGGRRTVDQLRGPTDSLTPDFRKTITARKADAVELRSRGRLHALTFDGQVPGPNSTSGRETSSRCRSSTRTSPKAYRSTGTGSTCRTARTAWRASPRTRCARRALHVSLPRRAGRNVLVPLAPDRRRTSEARALRRARHTPEETAAGGGPHGLVHTFPDAVVIGRATEPTGSFPPGRGAAAPRQHGQFRRSLTGAAVPRRRDRRHGSQRPTPLEERRSSLARAARYDLAFTMPSAPVKLEVVGAKAALVEPPGVGGEPLRRLRPASTRPATARRHPRRSPRRATSTAASGRHRSQAGASSTASPASHWSVNGELYPDADVSRRGRGLVKMTIRNDSGAAHPMHLHGHHFLVLSRNGRPVTGSPWWVDTLNLRSHERYEVGFRAQPRDLDVPLPQPAARARRPHDARRVRRRDDAVPRRRRGPQSPGIACLRRCSRRRLGPCAHSTAHPVQFSIPGPPATQVVLRSPERSAGETRRSLEPRTRTRRGGPARS